MTDFGAYRAMLLDFGIPPQAMDNMSLAEMSSLRKGMEARNGKARVPSKEEREEGMTAFNNFISSDPTVRIH